MKTKNELQTGVIISYITLILSTIIPMIYTPLMLRMLGQAEYGLYSLANSVIGYLSLLNFGMGNAAIRYITKFRAENDKDSVERVSGLFFIIYGFLAFFVVVGGICLSGGASYFFADGLNDKEIQKIKILVILMAINMALGFISSVYGAIINSYERFIFRKSIDLIVTVATPLINLLVLFMGYASIGMTLVATIIQVLYFVILSFFCVCRLNIIPKIKNPPIYLLKEIIGFSIFIFLGTIVDTLYWSTDKVLLGAMMSTSAVAVYNIGGTFTTMLQSLASVISSVFTPRITTMVVQNNNEKELSNLLIKVGRIQYLIVSLVLTGFILFGKYFIIYWAGEGYIQAYEIALFTMIPLSIPLIQSIAFGIIIAQNKHQFRAIIYLCIAILNAISTYLVIPHYGMLGAAACTGIAFIIGTGVIINIYYYKVIKLEIPLFWKNIAKMTVWPVCIMTIYFMFGFNQTTGFTGLIVKIIVYCFAYFVGEWVFVMNEYEKNLLRNVFKGILKR
ncbi:MAG: oligosaccharide flippase family protein [Anaerostipes sp.]|uniref:oligosaccharide flippase family protein n=1 Tax=Anaerostipes sp. TaxID=1872530 RepID=UPI00399538B5